MPYNHIRDLPENIRNVLPEHAQEIYLSSFNNAYDQYKNKKKRSNPKDDLEVISHKVAWSAVKKKYTKNKDGQWVEKA